MMMISVVTTMLGKSRLVSLQWRSRFVCTAQLFADHWRSYHSTQWKSVSYFLNVLLPRHLALPSVGKVVDGELEVAISVRHSESDEHGRGDLEREIGRAKDDWKGVGGKVVKRSVGKRRRGGEKEQRRAVGVVDDEGGDGGGGGLCRGGA
eukprot:6172719-Pleurochrysis_carterae.AAC.1